MANAGSSPVQGTYISGVGGVWSSSSVLETEERKFKYCTPDHFADVGKMVKLLFFEILGDVENKCWFGVIGSMTVSFPSG